MHPYEIVLQAQMSSSAWWDDLLFFWCFLLPKKCQGERVDGRGSLHKTLTVPSAKTGLLLVDLRVKDDQTHAA
jgi:hypothetical protein